MTDQELQAKLKDLGFYWGAIDGIVGPKTEQAIVAFKKSVGLRARPYVGPITTKALKDAVVLPWMAEINRVLGLHEVRDNGALTAWLRSDGHLLGDPAKLPWCGDAVETAVRLGIPDEVFPERLEANPYWARNWASFGVACGEVQGAVASFVRPSGGHVAFLVGINPARNLYRIRGGNQSNMINDVWIEKSRCIALRWPSTVPKSLQKPLPVLSSNGAPVSQNEA